MADSRNFVTLILAIGLVAAVLVLSKGGAVPAAEIRTIQVTGQASTTTMPDEAVIMIRVEHTSQTAEQAQKLVANDIRNVMAALKKDSIPDDKIETASFRVYPQYEWDNIKQKSELTGYTASHTLKVTTTDVGNVGRLLDDSVSAGANAIDQVSFQLTTESQNKLRKELLKKAGEDARLKAESMAAGVNVRLGKVVSVQESGPIYFPVFYSTKAMTAEAGGAPTQISPQTLEVSASISVGYEIR